MNVLRHFSSTYRLYKNQKRKNRIKPKQKNDYKSALHSKKKTKKCLLKSCLTRCGAYSLCSARDSLI